MKTFIARSKKVLVQAILPHRHIVHSRILISIYVFYVPMWFFWRNHCLRGLTSLDVICFEVRFQNREDLVDKAK
jgi:hypothetical protein